MLIGQLHQEVTAEYVKRLLKGDVKLKNKELQLKAYTTVRDNAESLHGLFIAMVRLKPKITNYKLPTVQHLEFQDKTHH